jgi:phosphatidate cytidylyltransferase
VKEALIRSATGIAFVSLVILSFVFHPAGYILLFSLVCAGAWLELQQMFPEHFPRGLRIPVALFISGSFILVYFIAARIIDWFWIFLPPSLLVVSAITAWISLRDTELNSMLFLTGSVLYILAGFSAMHFLAFTEGTGTESGAGTMSGSLDIYNPKWIILSFIILWTYDTMAYVSGRLTGKHPVWPSVSPAKTWEGILGGTLFAAGLALILSRYYPELSAAELALLAVILILAGNLGDFLESWLKRRAGVKDSGRLLPGHGGLLDRFDSLLPALPLVLIYLNVIL